MNPQAVLMNNDLIKTTLAKAKQLVNILNTDVIDAYTGFSKLDAVCDLLKDYKTMDQFFEQMDFSYN